MMDPVMLFVIGGAVISLLVVLTYYFLSKEEGDFEKVYNTSALALLTESDKKEKKGKGKNVKKEKKQQHQQQKDQQKEQQKEEVETDDEEPIVKSQPQKVSESVAMNEVTMTNSAPSPSIKSVQVKSVEHPKEQSPKQPSPQESPKENGQKKKSSKVVNVKELDHKKVLSRLSAIADLEEGYVQFLTTSFRDSDLLKNNLSSEVKALHKKLADSNQKMEKLQKEKNTFADREKQEQNKQAALSSKIQSLQSRESELTQSVQAAQANLQQREEAHTKEIQELRKKISSLENEVHSQKASNGKLAVQLKNVQTQLAGAPTQAEHTELHSEISGLTEKIAKLEKVAREMGALHESKVADYLALSQEAAQMEKAISELEENLATSRRDLVAQTEREAKKDLATKKLEEEKAAWLKKDAESQRLKMLVEGLNKDVSEFHEYKMQQEKVVKELRTREESRLKEHATEKAHFHAKESTLQKELETERSKLMAAERALVDEKARVVEIPRNSDAPAVIEEVFELKKTNSDLAAAPGTSTPSADLVAKVAQLEEKNDELRGRNYTLLEKTEEVPKTIIKERRRVVEHVGKLVGKPFKNVDDETAFFDWLGESVNGVEKNLSAIKTPSTQIAPPVANSVATTSQNDSYYRNTVVSLLSQLELIEELADKMEKQKAQKA